MSTTAGAVLGHYNVIEKIGEGGMGEVYLAEDTKLDRKVAIKLLPEEFSRDEGRPRPMRTGGAAPGAARSPEHRERDAECP